MLLMKGRTGVTEKMIYTPVLPSWKTASKQSSASQENPHSMEAKFLFVHQLLRR